MILSIAINTSISKKSLLCIVSIFMLALSGCGGGGTGDSSSSNFSSSSSSNSSSSSLTAYTISGTNSPGANITISGTAVSNTATTASNFSFNVQSGDSVVLTATKIGNTCSVSGSSVNPVAGTVSDLTVTCTPDTHTLAVSNPAAASVSITGTTQTNSASSATSITFNDTYGDTNVTVTASKAGNNCVVGGTIPSPITGNVTGVTVTCTPIPFTIAVSNPAAASVSITGTTQTNSASSATSITFNDTYGDTNVTISASKAGNNCVVGGTAIPNPITGNVTGVTISCTPIAYTLSGTNNTGAILSANGSTAATGNAITGTTSFSLSARYGDPVAFTATKTGNTCSVSGSSVNPVAGTVSDLTVTCTPFTYALSGTNNTGATLSANGSTAATGNAITGTTNFSLSARYGDPVVFTASKAGNNCSVSGSSVNSVAGAVSDLTVTCTPISYTLSGSNTTGATLSANGSSAATGNAITGTTNFSLSARYGDPVLFTASKAGNNCSVSGSSVNPVAGAVSDLSVTCNPITYTVSGTVTGNTGPVTLINAGVTNTVSATGGDFSFTVNSGSNWNVSVSSKPATQTCLLNGGPVSGSNIQSDQIGILVQCTDNTYTVSGSITGYNSSGSSLLALELKDTTTSGTLQTLTNITNTNSAFNFTSAIAQGHDWSVTVVNQPTGQTCSLTANGSGTNITGNVSNVAVSCSNNSGTTYTVSGTVSGHTGTVTLTNNGANPQTVSIGGSNFTFTAQNAGSNYSVIATSASGQACSVSTNGTGSNISSDISNVVVTCLNANIILGTPTSNSIAMKLFTPDQNGTVSVSYGTSSGTTYSASTTPAALIAGTPLTINLTSLNPDGQYYYRLNFTPLSGGSTNQTEEYQFHTARLPGSSFTFTMQADPHMDDKSEYALYTQTLLNVASDKPDFHIDLGDTFMTEKWYTYSVQSCTAVALPNCPAIYLQDPVTSEIQTQARYKYELGNFGKVAKTVPLFLVNGNHDAELGWLAPVTTLPTWAYTARMQYFLSPVKDSFYDGVVYSSGATRLPSYYSWRWGDALFVALDPFFYSNKTSKNQSGWNMTLGTTQYQWLATTLANATADGVKYKFIFMHNLVGGVPEINKATGSPDIDPTTTKPYIGGSMRGGAQAAKYFEWGGLDYDGTTNLFATKRLASQGWTVPIHQLLVNNKVTAVFHGHDHLYYKETLDGVVYQEVPQPSAASTSNGATLAKEGGYLNGTPDSNSGYLRVTTTPTGVTTQYIRTWLPIGTPGTSNVENGTTRINKQVSQSWSCTYQSSGTNAGWCQ